MAGRKRIHLEKIRDAFNTIHPATAEQIRDKANIQLSPREVAAVLCRTIKAKNLGTILDGAKRLTMWGKEGDFI